MPLCPRARIRAQLTLAHLAQTLHGLFGTLHPSLCRFRRKRPVALSITHNSIAGFEAECDVSEARKPAPQNYIAWRRIARPSKVAAKSGYFYYIVGYIFLSAGVLVDSLDQVIEQF